MFSRIFHVKYLPVMLLEVPCSHARAEFIFILLGTDYLDLQFSVCD